jgi:hypothetical protein
MEPIPAATNHATTRATLIMFRPFSFMPLWAAIELRPAGIARSLGRIFDYAGHWAGAVSDVPDAGGFSPCAEIHGSSLK